MKTRLALICLTLLSITFSAEAKKKPAPAATPAATPDPAGEAPSARLGKFMKAHLDEVLAPLDKKGLKDAQAIIELRESLADAAAKLPPAQRASYQSAEVVCQAMVNAYTEREKSISSLRGSTAVHADNQLGAIRKDNPGDNELWREQQEQKQRNKAAHTQDSFFTESQKTQWLKRADLYREQIEQLYARQRETEREVNAAISAAAAAATSGAAPTAAPAPGPGASPATPSGVK
jgi:hypothetical protein